MQRVATTKEMIEAVKAHALAHYNKGGWDFVVECWSDAEIATAIFRCTTCAGAIAKMGRSVKLHDEQRQEARNA